MEKIIELEEKFLQFADREGAQKYMKKNGYDCYKVIGEYNEFIEVVFGKVKGV